MAKDKKPLPLMARSYSKEEVAALKKQWTNRANRGSMKEFEGGGSFSEMSPGKYMWTPWAALKGNAPLGNTSLEGNEGGYELFPPAGSLADDPALNTLVPMASDFAQTGPTMMAEQGLGQAAKAGWKAFRAARAEGKAAATAAKAAAEVAPAAAKETETLGQVASNFLKPKNLLKVGAGGAAIMVGKDQISTAMKNYQDRQNTALQHEEELKNQRAQNQYAEELAASPRMQEEKLNSARAVMTKKLQDEAAQIWEAANRQKNTLYAPLSADIFQSSLAIYQPEVARQMKGP